MTIRRTRRLVAAGALATTAAMLVGCSGGGGNSGGDGSELSIYIDSAESTVAQFEGIIAAYAEANPDVTITTETHPAGGEGDNLVKTRLATGEMNDLFYYNSGSLFQALNPDQTLVDLSDQPWVDKLEEDFVTTVSTDQGIYGAPASASFAGAMVYSKTVYEQLGLEVPTTWSEFMANNEAIKAAGITPIAQTYGDTWTSQLFVLGDFYNVLAQDPDWAEKYTNNEAKYVDEPAIDGFRHQQEAFEAGYFNQDFASATYDDGVRMLAEGTAAHYPMLTGNVAGNIGSNYPDAADAIGVFGIPTDAEGVENGVTVWMPNGMYVPKSTEGAQLDAAMEFLEWLTSPEGCEAIADSVTLGGPFVVEGCELPSDVPAIVSDLQPYFDEGRTGLALEFLSPIKGPALEQITVEVGSGIRSAEDGAALYDEDVEKQAQQLGLEGW
ncbi:ABC transporter substrate-binding protein [Desertivibrio insolitus]|uniref:ABC transporter substrate-binding protein n=1 Tax=Herbiconiux sp. SYSU D00978 TaxID=2812562 RepID=UPI001A974F95|nr:extracellular solute-binding protein [Herbiconiux sp. SYSU D00978]